MAVRLLPPESRRPALGLLLLACGLGWAPGSAHADVRAACRTSGEVLVDDDGNTLPPGQCTWRARREAKYFRDCIDAAPRPRHARSWIEIARSCGFEVSDRCVPGAIAVTQAGPFGHVGICEGDLGDGTFLLTDMNHDGRNRGACRNAVVERLGSFQFILPPRPAREPAAEQVYVAAAGDERAPTQARPAPSTTPPAGALPELHLVATAVTSRFPDGPSR